MLLLSFIMILLLYYTLALTITCNYLACIYVSYNRLLALLFFFVIALAILCSFVEYEKLSQPLKYLFSGFALGFAVIHYTTTLTLYAEGVFYEAPFLMKTCALGRCSITFDWGLVFLIAATIPHIPKLMVKFRVSRKTKDKNIKPLE